VRLIARAVRVNLSSAAQALSSTITAATMFVGDG
jgi:hypothetical protein